VPDLFSYSHPQFIYYTYPYKKYDASLFVLMYIHHIVMNDSLYGLKIDYAEIADYRHFILKSYFVAKQIME
jgi:hypothetical protein